MFQAKQENKVLILVSCFFLLDSSKRELFEMICDFFLDLAAKKEPSCVTFLSPPISTLELTSKMGRQRKAKASFRSLLLRAAEVVLVAEHPLLLQC